MDPEENKKINQEETEIPSEESPAPPQVESFKEKLQAFVRPLYMKVILSTLAFILFIWGAVSTCSSPHEMVKPRYSIALDPTWGALQLGNRENSMTAFIETILYDIAAKLDMRIVIYHASTDILFQEFEKGKYEGIVSMLLPPTTHAGISQPIVTSDPLYRLGPVLVVNSKSPSKTLESMSGKVVGLVGESRVDIKINQFPNVIFSGYYNASNAFADLNNHKIDGLIVDSLVAKNFVYGLYSDKLEIANFSLTNEGILLILHKSKNAEMVIEKFNKELKQLRENGTYASLLKTWHVQEE